MEDKEECSSSPTSELASRRRWLRRASTSSDLSPPSLGGQTGQSHNQRRLSVYEKVIEQRMRRGLPLHDARRGSVISTTSNDEVPSSFSSNDHNHWRSYHLAIDPLNEATLTSLTDSRRVACSDLVARVKPVASGCLPLLDSLQHHHHHHQQQQQWSAAAEQSRRRCSLAEQTRCVRFREGWKSARGTGSIVATSTEEDPDTTEIAPIYHAPPAVSCDVRKDETAGGKQNKLDTDDGGKFASRIVSKAVKAAINKHCQSFEEQESLDREQRELKDKNDSSSKASPSGSHQAISDKDAAVEKENQVANSNIKSDYPGVLPQESINDDDSREKGNSLPESIKNNGASIISGSLIDKDEIRKNRSQANDKSGRSARPSTPLAEDESPLSSDLRVVMAGPIKWSRSDSDSAALPGRKDDNSTSCDDVMSPHARMLICARDRLLLRRWTLADGLGVTRKDKASIRRNLVYLGTAQTEVSQRESCSESELVNAETGFNHLQVSSEDLASKHSTSSAENGEESQELNAANLEALFDSEKGVLVFEGRSQTWRQRSESDRNHSESSKGTQRRFSCDVSSLFTLCKNS